MDNTPSPEHSTAIVPCDLCGSTAQQTVWERGRGDVDLKNVVCTHCGLVFISPRLSEQAIAEQYSSGGFSMEARGASAPSKQ